MTMENSPIDYGEFADWLWRIRRLAVENSPTPRGAGPCSHHCEQPGARADIQNLHPRRRARYCVGRDGVGASFDRASQRYLVRSVTPGLGDHREVISAEMSRGY